MIHTVYLITTIHFLFFSLIGISIVATALIIALAIIMSISE